MAKKKAKTGPKPKPGGTRDALIAIKCRDEYKAWVIEFALDERVTPSQLFDIAVSHYAASKGRTPPPTR